MRIVAKPRLAVKKAQVSGRVRLSMPVLRQFRSVIRHNQKRCHCLLSLQGVKLMNLVILFVSIGVLLGVFFCAMRSRPATLFVRSVCAWVARPCAVLTIACLHVATACKQGCLRCLRGSEQAEKEGMFLV